MKILFTLLATLLSVSADAAMLTLSTADGAKEAIRFESRAACAVRMCEIWRNHACGAPVACDPDRNTTTKQLCPSKKLKPHSILLSATCAD